MRLIQFFMLIGLIAMVTACGYHLEGGGYINQDVTRVAVLVFENKSSETRAGMSFTNNLIQEIQTKTDTVVVDLDKTTRKIVGVINSITFSALARTNIETVVERQVTAVVDIKLVEPDGDIILSVKNMTATESYQVDSDKVNDTASKQAAVDKIALRTAEKVVSQMMNDF
jgi:outer membrane lipopolysaccharide assembly protein LptE/RlpB